MRTVKSGVILVIGIGTLLAGFGMVRVLLGQGDDDLSIISQMTTTTQRKNFFRTLTPERKTALWRKHLAVELTQAPGTHGGSKECDQFGYGDSQSRLLHCQSTECLQQRFSVWNSA